MQFFVKNVHIFLNKKNWVDKYWLMQLKIFLDFGIFFACIV